MKFGSWGKKGSNTQLTKAISMYGMRVHAGFWFALRICTNHVFVEFVDVQYKSTIVYHAHGRVWYVLPKAKCCVLLRGKN
jgi:hypothetical protein